MRYNRRIEYKDEVEATVRRLIEVCAKARIPYFMTFAVEDDGKNTFYINEMMAAEEFDDMDRLSDNHIAKHLLVKKGFEVVPPRMSYDDDYVEEMEVDED